MMQELGKYCLDMSKLIFGGVILAAIGFNFILNQDSIMAFIYFLIATGLAGLILYLGVMWYDRKHQYDW